MKEMQEVNGIWREVEMPEPPEPESCPWTGRCLECDEELQFKGEGQTLVGYGSPPGHKHDDNCRKREYVCANKHWTVISKVRTCPTCEWRGKSFCWCHPYKKFDEWPQAERTGRTEMKP